MVSFSGGAIFVAAVLAAVCIVPIVRLAAAVVCLASRKKDALRYGRAARGFYYHNGARRAFKGVREEDDVVHDDTAFVRCDRSRRDSVRASGVDAGVAASACAARWNAWKAKPSSSR